MKSFGVSSSFLRRCTVSASSERTYACRSCTWISYSVSRRRVLESDMEAGRNFENPSRLGLLFLSNSFIAHPFSRCRVCALCARPLASCSKYRRLEKRKSRLAPYLPPVESLNSLHFPPSLAAPDRKSTRLNSSHSQISYAVFCLKKKKIKKKTR